MNLGKNSIYIGLSEIGSYLSCGEPIAINLGDANDVRTLIVSQKNRTDLSEIFQLGDNQYENYKNKRDDLHKILKPLINKLQDKNYYWGWHEEGNGLIKPLDLTNGVKHHWSFVYPKKSICKSKESQIYSEFENYLNSKKPVNKRRIFEYSTEFYHHYGKCFIATKSEDKLTMDLVKHYEEEILRGKKPFIVTISAEYLSDYDLGYQKLNTRESIDFESGYYVIDGHHKLLAYKNLEIRPNIASIHLRYNSMKETKFDEKKLAKKLYHWQAEKILTDWERDWESRNKYQNGKRIRY